MLDGDKLIRGYIEQVTQALIRNPPPGAGITSEMAARFFHDNRAEVERIFFDALQPVVDAANKLIAESHAESAASVPAAPPAQVPAPVAAAPQTAPVRAPLPPAPMSDRDSETQHQNLARMARRIDVYAPTVKPLAGRPDPLIISPPDQRGYRTVRGSMAFYGELLGIGLLKLRQAVDELDAICQMDGGYATYPSPSIHSGIHTAFINKPKHLTEKERERKRKRQDFIVIEPGFTSPHHIKLTRVMELEGALAIEIPVIDADGLLAAQKLGVVTDRAYSGVPFAVPIDILPVYKNGLYGAEFVYNIYQQFNHSDCRIQPLNKWDERGVHVFGRPAEPYWGAYDCAGQSAGAAQIKHLGADGMMLGGTEINATVSEVLSEVSINDPHGGKVAGGVIDRYAGYNVHKQPELLEVSGYMFGSFVGSILSQCELEDENWIAPLRPHVHFWTQYGPQAADILGAKDRSDHDAGGFSERLLTAAAQDLTTGPLSEVVVAAANSNAIAMNILPLHDTLNGHAHATSEALRGLIPFGAVSARPLAGMISLRRGLSDTLGKRIDQIHDPVNFSAPGNPDDWWLACTVTRYFAGKNPSGNAEDKTLLLISRPITGTLPMDHGKTLPNAVIRFACYAPIRSYIWDEKPPNFDTKTSERTPRDAFSSVSSGFMSPLHRHAALHTKVHSLFDQRNAEDVWRALDQDLHISTPSCYVRMDADVHAAADAVREQMRHRLLQISHLRNHAYSALNDKTAEKLCADHNSSFGASDHIQGCNEFLKQVIMDITTYVIYGIEDDMRWSASAKVTLFANAPAEISGDSKAVGDGPYGHLVLPGWMAPAKKWLSHVAELRSVENIERISKTFATKPLSQRDNRVVKEMLTRVIDNLLALLSLESPKSTREADAHFIHEMLKMSAPPYSRRFFTDKIQGVPLRSLVRGALLYDNPKYAGVHTKPSQYMSLTHPLNDTETVLENLRAATFLRALDSFRMGALRRTPNRGHTPHVVLIARDCGLDDAGHACELTTLPEEARLLPFVPRIFISPIQSSRGERIAVAKAIVDLLDAAPRLHERILHDEKNRLIASNEQYPAGEWKKLNEPTPDRKDPASYGFSIGVARLSRGEWVAVGLPGQGGAIKGFPTPDAALKAVPKYQSNRRLEVDEKFVLMGPDKRIIFVYANGDWVAP